MEKLNILFLGTGNAIPTKARSHSAILLSYKNENILVDCGEGTQRQFKFANISPTKLTKILITHWHGDHILGLPGLFQTLKMSNYARTLHLYGPLGSKEAIKIIDKIARIKIKLEVHEISSTSSPFLDTQDFSLSAKQMLHQTPTLAYSFLLKDKIRLEKSKLKKFKLPQSPILKDLKQGKSISFKGKIISPKQVSKIEKGKKITFILDTKFNLSAVHLAKHSDLIISEASFSNSESALASEYLHLTAQQAATIAKKSNSKKMILTHISQRYEHSPEIILNEAKSIFKNTKVAKDLDKITI